MPPGLPASPRAKRARLVLAICAVLAPGVSFAERRPVAVIDLSADPAAQQLTNRIYNALLAHDDLSSFPHREFDDALAGPLLDEDGPAITLARQQATKAQDANGQLDYGPAQAAARLGLSNLVVAAPTHDVIALYADLAFALGEASVDVDATEAQRAFALVHRLDPIRPVDEIRFPPQVSRAFQKAKAATYPKVKLAIESTGHVWIDGQEVGAAPGSFDVEAGSHLVQVTGLERETRGMLVTVDKDTTVPIDPAPASDELKVKRARLALALAHDDAAARAGAMKQLAELLGVHDAVLISKKDDKLLVQTWRDRAPGFSAFVEHKSEKPVELLAPLAPPHAVEPPHVVQPPVKLGPILPVTPWYKTRWFQGSVIGSVIAAAIGGYFWAREEHDIMIGNNPTGKPDGRW